MAEPEKLPIPTELAEAFHRAIAELRGWTLGGNEPQVPYQRNSHLISAICEQVTAYEDSVPEWVQTVLLDMRIELPPELPGFTYSAAGRGCLKEISARKARFERTQNL